MSPSSDTVYSTMNLCHTLDCSCSVQRRASILSYLLMSSKKFEENAASFQTIWSTKFSNQLSCKLDFGPLNKDKCNMSRPILCFQELLFLLSKQKICVPIVCQELFFTASLQTCFQLVRHYPHFNLGWCIYTTSLNNVHNFSLF